MEKAAGIGFAKLDTPESSECVYLINHKYLQEG
jgi:hypothetical protein